MGTVPFSSRTQKIGTVPGSFRSMANGQVHLQCLSKLTICHSSTKRACEGEKFASIVGEDVPIVPRCKVQRKGHFEALCIDMLNEADYRAFHLLYQVSVPLLAGRLGDLAQRKGTARNWLLAMRRVA